MPVNICKTGVGRRQSTGRDKIASAGLGETMLTGTGPKSNGGQLASQLIADSTATVALIRPSLHHHSSTICAEIHELIQIAPRNTLIRWGCTVAPSLAA